MSIPEEWGVGVVPNGYPKSMEMVLVHVVIASEGSHFTRGSKDGILIRLVYSQSKAADI